MTNKTYTLNDGTVLKLGDVYEATPEGYLRMVAHHVEMFGMKYSASWLLDKEQIAMDAFQVDATDYLQDAPFTIIWLPEQVDDNVIPPDEVVAHMKTGASLYFVSPADGEWQHYFGQHFTHYTMANLEWLIAKGVTFYKNKPEGV